MPREVDTSKRIAALISIFFMFTFMLFSSSEDMAKGNLIGQIYNQDGSTPLEGASLALRNVATGKVYISPKSESDGKVILEDIEKGFYKLGILTDDGGFYAKDLLGLNIKGESTETIAVSIDPYSQKEVKAVTDLYEDMYGDDEALIGHVLQYFPDTGMAQVELTKGMLKKDAIVYFRGLTYNFRQQVEKIILDGKEVNEAYEGDIVLLNVKMPCEIGDLVFFCKKEGILPFILWGKPLGMLIIAAATGGVMYGIIKVIKEEPETSPFQPKR